MEKTRQFIEWCEKENINPFDAKNYEKFMKEQEKGNDLDKEVFELLKKYYPEINVDYDKEYSVPIHDTIETLAFAILMALKDMHELEQKERN